MLSTISYDLKKIKNFLSAKQKFCFYHKISRASPTFVRKKIKEPQWSAKQKLCLHHKTSCNLATFVSKKVCSCALNLFSAQIHSNIKSTFNPTISFSPVAIYRHQFLSISLNVSWILFPTFMITCISLIERSKM